MGSFSKARFIFNIVFIVVTLSILVGCSKKAVKESQSPVYHEIHSQAIGFSNKDNAIKPKPPAKSVYLFEDEASWEEFKNTYIKDISVPEVEFSKDKILYIHVRWPELASGPRYEVVGIKETNSKLQVNVQPLSYSTVNIKPSSNSMFFGYLIIVAIDRNTVSSEVIPALSVTDNKQ